MRKSLLIVPAVMAVAGCGGPSDTADENVQPPAAATQPSVDINAAADEAQGDIDTYAANSLENETPATPAPTPSPSPTGPPAPGEPGGLADDGTPVGEAPFAPESAQGAANVVQTYFALIGEHKYRQAWRLWSDGGGASGMSADAFAASFEKYRDYHANVGAPGRIDAGAGQRYVSVPVQAYGHLKDGGRAFNMRGKVTLHRTADIDGATEEQKSWRITNSALKPRPDEAIPDDTGAAAGAGETTLPNGMPATAAADYRCDDGTRFHIAFDNRADTGTVTIDGKQIAVLEGQRAASGIWYKGGGYELRGKGKSGDFTRPGKDAVACTVR